MLNHELLISKGFKLNEYPEEKYYELVIEDPSEELLDIIKFQFDPELIPDQVIFQTKEDFLNTVVAIDGEVWDMSVEELEEILNKM